MRFYIFGNNKNKDKKFIANRYKALYDSDNIDEAMKVFDQYVKMIKRHNLYLIADFELFGNKYLPSKMTDDDSSTIPFVIIANWNYTLPNDPDSYIRKDHMEIKRVGFTHSFDNNLLAIKFYIKHFTNEFDRDKLLDYNLEFNLIYKRYEFIDRFKLNKLEKRICRNIARPIITNSPCRYFIIDPCLDWEYDPIPIKYMCDINLKNKTFRKINKNLSTRDSKIVNFGNVNVLRPSKISTANLNTKN